MEEIISRLKTQIDALLSTGKQSVIAIDGYAFAGIPEAPKVKALPAAVYAAACEEADVVLVEADGSKHMPLKFPNATEPVIPENTDEIIVVWGPHGLGKPAREVCHRLELVLDCLGIDGDTPITAEHVQKLVTRGYLIPLRAAWPRAPGRTASRQTSMPRTAIRCPRPSSSPPSSRPSWCFSTTAAPATT